MSQHYIGILDYGSGNTFSLKQSLHKLGYRSYFVVEPQDFAKASVLMIPGVGAFPEAMECLQRKNLMEGIYHFCQSGKTIIGICLGMQLLAARSFEHQETSGLGLIPGDVMAIDQPPWHIGWNSIQHTNVSTSFLPAESSYYFNHSYQFAASPEFITATVNVGKPITASVQKDNIIGFQFHPEKSQLAGFNLLATLLKVSLC